MNCVCVDCGNEFFVEGTQGWKRCDVCLLLFIVKAGESQKDRVNSF